MDQIAEVEVVEEVAVVEDQTDRNYLTQFAPLVGMIARSRFSQEAESRSIAANVSKVLKVEVPDLPVGRLDPKDLHLAIGAVEGMMVMIS